ncbi:hypothetical protein N9Y42_03745 [Mariniblastus sp.]|nr:hypothetical protein [Mariniblastus sp.]
MKNLLVPVVVAICLVGLVGCGGGKQISKSELLGTWKSTTTSPEKNQVSKSEYTFKEGGKLSFAKDEKGDIENSRILMEGFWNLSDSSLDIRRRMVEWEKEGVPVDKIPDRELEVAYEIVSFSESELVLKEYNGTVVNLSR